jgi:2-iminobutanoate/2-iminopropanoate deaminase
MASNNAPNKLAFFSEILNAPKAIGPYSIACLDGQTLYCSGQIAIDPSTGKLVSDDFDLQLAQILRNLTAILENFKIGPEQIIKATVFLTDLSNFQKLNEAYSKWLGHAKPARSTVGVASLPAGAKVEIEIIAKVGNSA